MPEEYQPEQEYSEEPQTPQDTGLDEPVLDLDNETQPEETEVEAQEPEVVQTPAPRVTTPVAQTPAPTETPQGMAFATPRSVPMPDVLRNELSTFLSEEAMTAFDSYVDQKAEAKSEYALQASSAQDAEAQSLGVPAPYLQSVKQHLPNAQRVAATPKQAVQIAIQMELHQRTVQNGTDIDTEMEKYLQAKGRRAAEPTPPPAPRQKPKVEPLHPSAQPTRPAISSTTVRQPVRTNGATADPLYEHMPWLAPKDGEE